MVRNYLKVALRYLLRNKGYTAINIMGLAIGITCCVLIMLFVRSEFSYDKMHSKSGRIYRAWVREHYDDKDDIIDMTTPLPLAGALQSSFPEIESTCRVFNLNSLVKTGEQSFNEDLRMVDSTFFRVFDFALVEGNRENPFPTSNSIILTENESVFAPVSRVNYSFYNELKTLTSSLHANADIQCIVGKNFIPFGQAQSPSLNDYADGIDTMEFLKQL